VSFFDRIRYHRPPKSPQEADALALRQLSTRGANLTKPRHVIHFLLFENEADADAAADAIRGTSWDARVEPPSESHSEWTVRADDERIVSVDTVASYRSWFEQIATQHNGEYDGWEAKDKP
jgi:Regulator of ribonuclease activity B